MQSKIEDLPGETWKDVIEYEGLYMVGNLGRAKSLFKRVQVNRVEASGKITVYFTEYPEKLLSLYAIDGGYYLLCLSKNSKQKTFPTHRLIARAFLPNTENLPVVHHKNHCK